MSVKNVRKRPRVMDVKGRKSVYASYRLIPYPEIEEIIRSGGEAFVEGIDRRTAYSAGRTLSRRLGFPIKQRKMVVVTREVSDEEVEGIEGYIFEAEKKD